MQINDNVKTRIESSQPNRKESGLTLIEVLIVVFIISIILAIVIPNYANSTKRAQEKLCEAAVRMVNAQIELYRIDHGKEISATSPKEVFYELIAKGYLREEPTCALDDGFSWKDGLIEWSEPNAAKSENNGESG